MRVVLSARWGVDRVSTFEGALSLLTVLGMVLYSRRMHRVVVLVIDMPRGDDDEGITPTHRWGERVHINPP